MAKGGPGKYHLGWGEECLVSYEEDEERRVERWVVPEDRRRYVIRSLRWWKDYQYRCNRSLRIILESCECELEKGVDWEFKDKYGWVEIDREMMKKFDSGSVLRLEWDKSGNKGKREILEEIRKRRVVELSEEEKLRKVMRELGIDGWRDVPEREVEKI